jgi:uncharacterized protein YkwD
MAWICRRKGILRRLMRRALPISLLAVAAIVAPLPATATAACSSAVPSLSSSDTATARAAILCAVNAERGARGLAAYTDSGALDQAAQGYAGSMVSGSFFDHVSPGGSTVVDRVRATGWIPAAGSYGLGEAIAWAGAPLDSATGIVAMWMASPPHRAILLDANYREAGIGVAPGVPDGSGAPGATVVLDAGVRSGSATGATSGSGAAQPATKPATKVAAWRSAKTCARAARRSRKARALCASISKRSKHSIRAPRHSSTRNGTIWMVRRTSLRAIS